MSWGEAFRSARDSLATRKLRAGLTMLGVMFGVGAVIGMLAIGAGAAAQAQDLIDRLGMRNVLVRARQLRPDDLREARKKSLGLSLRDVQAIEEAVPGVAMVGPRLKVEPWRIQAAGAKTEGTAYGVSHKHQSLLSLSLAEGRFIDRQDDRAHAQVCVVGAGLRRDLFVLGPALGRRLKVNDLWCEVVGVLAPAGQAASDGESPGGSLDRAVFLPINTVTRKLERDPLASPLDEVIVRLTDKADSRQTAAVVKSLLDKLHGGIDDYETVVPEALLDQSRQTQRLFNIVMGCIAGISLLVGGIGIMNIMLASVLERTREIGVRRAIGAARGDVVLQFLVEAFTLSAIGGLLGVAIGVALAKSVALYAAWPTIVTPASIVISLAVSVAVGLLSGLYPALRAARVPPIEALRYE
ncbi:MAG: ABC transporter permease [Myxococcales bacterium]|nr:ABC transporter permease [Myxococcales bacterium]